MCVATQLESDVHLHLSHQVDAELAKVYRDNYIETLSQRPSAEAWSQNLHRRVSNDENMPPVLVFRITELLVAKRPFSSEQTSMEYVRQHTSIPVLCVHHPHLNWLIMDYVDGDMLYEYWAKQSRFTQYRIACALRLYIKQLRSLKSVNVGALGTGRVSGILFQDYAFGPFDYVWRFQRFCGCVSLVGWEMRMKIR
ncbi:hypothetical protein DAEQUDRAFT_787450 [Daedalea quercina L-15889]|uniref:Aminoglycoside phosphotransferase domain-containing protein n=1 Tax=Daedalea quercina L-15889 TaxID=1314783 RepID=A0A165TZ39_9APHY|nr:hypothetical protein DAEQUDRAFT_787450 [Daedalea quercina L-15889]